VDAGADDDFVVVYSVCELENGEILDGGLGQDTLITPVDEQALAALGVNVSGFEVIDVRPELTSLSDCSCFNGTLTTITDDEVTCTCDEGWTGPTCTSCDDEVVCAPPEQVAQLATLLLASQPEDIVNTAVAQVQTGVIAHSAVRADLVILARPKSIVEYYRAPDINPNRPEPATRVTLWVDDVIKGPALDEVTFSFIGTSTPNTDDYGSESPGVIIGEPRIFSLQLRAGENCLAEEGSDWKVDLDGTVLIGAYPLSYDVFRESLQLVSQP
jgi:hypothetical protein